MSREVKSANITKSEDGSFNATIQFVDGSEHENFETFDDANDWLVEMEAADVLDEQSNNLGDAEAEEVPTNSTDEAAPDLTATETPGTVEAPAQSDVASEQANDPEVKDEDGNNSEETAA